MNITEPDPANRPFIWVPKSAKSTFTVCVCGDCGYTESYADNFEELKEKHQKGFK